MPSLQHVVRATPQPRRRFASAFTPSASKLAAVALTAAVCAAGCNRSDKSSSSSPPAAGTITATAAQPAAADTDNAAKGTGLPAGYLAQFDREGATNSDASYREKEPGRWEVKTGSAHILYSPRDTATNKYSTTATFEQLEAPAHPEAFGVFVGGSNLDAPTARYTYFIVRGDGKYMVKVRDGANTRTITDWTAHPSIPVQDASGKGLYGIRIEVSGKSANVSVNGVPITTITGKDIPLNGITGVRINHNLHLIVTPVSVIRGRA